VPKGDDVMLPPGEDSVLLERASELATLERSLAKARDGRGSLVLVSGEAGVGKTALVRSVAASAPRSRCVSRRSS
jgi:predicted ATPase